MTSSPGPLLSLRSAVLLFAAVIIGVLAGCLSYLDEPSVAGAVLWGGGACAGALVLLHSVIGG